MDIKEKSNWKIIYSNYDGIERSAINFVSREMGKYVLRNMGEYSLPVLAIEKYDVSQVDTNAVIIGLHDDVVDGDKIKRIIDVSHQIENENFYVIHASDG